MMCKKNSAPKLHKTRSKGYFRVDAEERAVGLMATEEDELTTAAFRPVLVVILGSNVIIEVMGGIL
jgi:hypothetical protein